MRRLTIDNITRNGHCLAQAAFGIWTIYETVVMYLLTWGAGQWRGQATNSLFGVPRVQSHSETEHLHHAPWPSFKTSSPLMFLTHQRMSPALLLVAGSAHKLQFAELSSLRIFYGQMASFSFRSWVLAVIFTSTYLQLLSFLWSQNNTQVTLYLVFVVGVFSNYFVFAQCLKEMHSIQSTILCLLHCAFHCERCWDWLARWSCTSICVLSCLHHANQSTAIDGLKCHLKKMAVSVLRWMYCLEPLIVSWLGTWRQAAKFHMAWNMKCHTCLVLFCKLIVACFSLQD